MPAGGNTINDFVNRKDCCALETMSYLQDVVVKEKECDHSLSICRRTWLKAFSQGLDEVRHKGRNEASDHLRVISWRKETVVGAKGGREFRRHED